MSIISKVVGKTQGTRRLPERDLGTDLRRRTLLERRVTPALEVPRDPLAKAEGSPEADDPVGSRGDVVRPLGRPDTGFEGLSHLEKPRLDLRRSRPGV